MSDADTIREYTVHRHDCALRIAGENCDCGLDTVLARLVAPAAEEVCPDCGIPLRWCRAVTSNDAHCWRWDYEQMERQRETLHIVLGHIRAGHARDWAVDAIRDALAAQVEQCRCVYPDKCSCPPEARVESGEVDWLEDAGNDERPTMRHEFSGDPWGRCSKCDHPAYHLIHRTDG